MLRREFLEAAALAASGALAAQGCTSPLPPEAPTGPFAPPVGNKKRILFLSDTHIGIDASTNWYQRELHEPLLLAVFDYVAAQADSIAELVLLGDIVDQWTYLPDVRPPSFSDITAANPVLFAPGEGALARAIEALDGKVTWLAGNHDMQTGKAEIAAIRDRAGRGIRFTTDFPYLPAAGMGHVACAHGHQFSIFNSPDPSSLLPGELPMGHFVTRLAALWSADHLSAGQTVADRVGSGEPTGWVWEKDELTTLVSDLFHGKDSLAGLVSDAFVRATKVPTSLPVTLFDGTTVTVDDVAKRLYANLYHGFTDSRLYPGSAWGRSAAFHALVSTDLHSDLSHFARELGRRYKVVVLGHTHVAVDQMQSPFGAPNLYANCGFGCWSRPEMTRAYEPERVTFIEVEVDPAERKLTVLVRAVEPTPTGPRVAALPRRADLIGW